MDFWQRSIHIDDEYEKLVMRMNPPRVTVDNVSSNSTTIVKVESANKRGCLLEVVQVLTDLGLTVRRAYISSDGRWFMDVFHVVDHVGNKVTAVEVIESIQQLVGARCLGMWSIRQSVGVQAAAEHTTIELIGRDRPGLLSEIFAVLADLNCNVVASEVWTHRSRMAAVVYVTDEASGLPIDDPDCISKVKQRLLYILKDDKEGRNANTAVSMCGTHRERRLHQMMYADQGFYKDDMDEDYGSTTSNVVVTIDNCVEKGYSVVNVRGEDRPKMLFDTVCTLTDMQYVVFHGTVIVEGTDAYQEFYIRDIDGFFIQSEAEKQQLVQCLKAAIERRSSEGLRLELCTEDRVGLLSDLTRIFRENGLSVTKAEVATRGSQARNVFYVIDASGNPVNRQTIEAIRNEIGQAIVDVGDDARSKPLSHNNAGFSLGSLFRSRSEKFLYHLGLVKSCS